MAVKPKLKFSILGKSRGVCSFVRANWRFRLRDTHSSDSRAVRSNVPRGSTGVNWAKIFSSRFSPEIVHDFLVLFLKLVETRVICGSQNVVLHRTGRFPSARWVLTSIQLPESWHAHSEKSKMYASLKVCFKIRVFLKALVRMMWRW